MKNADKTEFENFEETHPHSAVKWHPTKIGILRPKMLLPKASEESGGNAKSPDFAACKSAG